MKGGTPFILVDKYELSEADYQQIVLWTTQLGTFPAALFQILKSAPKFDVEQGRLTIVSWDIDKLPIEEIKWVPDLHLREFNLYSSGQKRKHWPTFRISLPYLEKLLIAGVSLGHLFLENLPELEEVSLPSKVQKIIINNAIKLNELEAANCGISEVYISNAPSLKTLSCNKNEIIVLELAGCSNLKNLFCYKNRLTELDVSGLVNLREIACLENELEALDLSKNNQIAALYCSNNRLNEMKMPRMEFLTVVECQSNCLPAFDLSKMPSLEYLNCANNKIKELDLTQCPNLRKVDCSCNDIATLDLTNNPCLESIKCDSDTKIIRQQARYINIERVNRVRENLQTNMSLNVSFPQGNLEKQDLSTRPMIPDSINEEDHESQTFCEEAYLRVEIEHLDEAVASSVAKRQLHSVVNLLRIANLRTAAGLKVPPMSLHLVFFGSTETGWTNVAKIIGRIYKRMGLLESGHVFSINGRSLAGDDTALAKALDQARDGVLFIDNADGICLVYEDDSPFTLLKSLELSMENNRGRMAIIMAGKRKEMEHLLSVSSKLSAQFPIKIEFEDFSTSDLTLLFENLAAESDYRVESEALSKIALIFNAERQKPDFSHQIFVKSLFETIVRQQADRIASLRDPAVDQLKSITVGDVTALSLT